MKRTVVLAAFEPFGKRRRNASWEAARRVGEATGITPVQLPVRFAALQREVRKLLAGKPAVLLLLGEAWTAKKLRVERVALNLVDARIPDNGRKQPRDLPVVVGGPPAYFVTVDPKALAKLAGRVAPTELSLSAGAFACNAALYQALHQARGTQVGFIHVPSSPRAVKPLQVAKALVRVVEALQRG